MKKRLLISALAALATLSCTKGELDGSGTELGQIKVISTIAGAPSKGLVTDPASVLTDVAFVHAYVSSVSDPVSFAGQSAFGGSRAATGEITFAPVQNYDKQGKISYLMGYHPAGTVGTDQASWALDGATDILLTDLWNAGTYTAPITSGMLFKHALARIEVCLKIAAGSGSAAAIDTWGNIDGISFKNAATTLTFHYNTNKMTAGDHADFPLLSGDFYVAGPFIPCPVNTPGVVASAMLPPLSSGTFTLIIKSAKQLPTEVTVTLDNNQIFEAGKVHTVTLSLNASDKSISATTTTITPWNSGDAATTPALAPVIITPGKGLYSIMDKVGTSLSYTGYNGLYGQNTGSDPLTYTNGQYYVTASLAYAGEPVYAKFEVAKKDAYAGASNNMDWTVLQGTQDNHIDNICVKTHGNGWRIPRLSELKLMYENQVELNKAVGFTGLLNSYWSATEYNATYAWIVNFSDGSVNHIGKDNSSYEVRCIKELPVPAPPKIGDYYYSDNSYSPTFDSGKTLLGVIYRVNANGTGMIVDVKDVPIGIKWSTVQEPTGTGEDSGVYNTNIIKGLADWATKYPIFKQCEDKNTGGVTLWYLPSLKELRALYAGYSGLRWMASGANSANGEIDDWNNTAMPGNATYATARTAFDAKMTAAGVGGNGLVASNYWSASEYNAIYAWYVAFSKGSTDDYGKANTNFKARCVRAF